MIGQAIDTTGKTYNIVILAGGDGTRMGIASDHIPKALSEIGNKRAIDYIIERYYNISNKIIIGTHSHADLLTYYIIGRYGTDGIDFSFEDELENNAVSAAYAIDRADVRYPTLVTFCDLIILSNYLVYPDTVYVADEYTKGNVGTFRHTIDCSDGLNENSVIKHSEPVKVEQDCGVLGHFIFGNTAKLKAEIFNNFDNLKDFTEDIAAKYRLKAEVVNTVYEFGTYNDLLTVRGLWEDA